MSFDVDRFVSDVRRANAQDGQAAVQEVIAHAVSDPADVLRGIGAPKEAGIHPLFQGPALTILNVVWSPMMVLLPHEHAMWATIGIYTGREDNILWRRSGPRVEACGAASLSEREVFPLPVDAVHSVTNPIPRLTGAIHVYGGDFFGKPRSEWDPDTLAERPFDLEAARQRFRDAALRFRAGAAEDGR